MPVERLGVVGAGTMGSGIAEVAVLRGFPTVLHDVEERIVDAARGRIQASLERQVQRHRLPPDEAQAALARLRTTTRLDDLAGCGLIIEAAPEDLRLKRELFAALDRIAPPGAILASNTSSLSITALAAATGRSDRVVGLHFFNPPPLMALVEVIPGSQTAPETVEAATTFVGGLGKTPVRAKDTPGFIVNRIARPFYLEALRLLANGVASAAEIDRIMRMAGGFRMGPFELLDLIGLDVNLAVTKSIYEAFFHEPRFRPHPLQERMVQAGSLGKKTGRGFYVYGEQGRAQPASDSPRPELAPSTWIPRHVVVVGEGDLAAGFVRSAQEAGWRVVQISGGVWHGRAEQVPDSRARKLRWRWLQRINLQFREELDEARGADLVADFLVGGWWGTDKLAAFHNLLPVVHPNAVWISLALEAPVLDIGTSRLLDGSHWRDLPTRLVGLATLPPWADRRLVEVIPGPHSRPEAVARAAAALRGVGKDVAILEDRAGGVFPRIFAKIVNEAAFALQEGVAIADDIDRALQLGANHPRGPLALADEIGLAVILTIINAVHKETWEESDRPSPFLQRIVQAGWTGRSAGRGFFDYSGRQDA